MVRLWDNVRRFSKPLDVTKSGLQVVGMYDRKSASYILHAPFFISVCDAAPFKILLNLGRYSRRQQSIPMEVIVEVFADSLSTESKRCFSICLVLGPEELLSKQVNPGNVGSYFVQLKRTFQRLFPGAFLA